MNSPPNFIHLFFRQVWRILKMNYPSLEWKRPMCWLGKEKWTLPVLKGVRIKRVEFRENVNLRFPQGIENFA